MEIIHLLVSVSLSGITASGWLHRPYWHTLDNSHQALGDISFVQLFYWKKLCQDSWWQTSVMRWISTVGQGVTHFPIFFYPFCRRPGKKCFIESCLVSTVTCDTPHTPPLAPSPLCDSGHEKTNQALRLDSFYFGILLVRCHKQQRNLLVRFCLVIMGFPLPSFPWR